MKKRSYSKKRVSRRKRTFRYKKRFMKKSRRSDDSVKRKILLVYNIHYNAAANRAGFCVNWTGKTAATSTETGTFTTDPEWTTFA